MSIQHGTQFVGRNTKMEALKPMINVSIFIRHPVDLKCYLILVTRQEIPFSEWRLAHQMNRGTPWNLKLSMAPNITSGLLLLNLLFLWPQSLNFKNSQFGRLRPPLLALRVQGIVWYRQFSFRPLYKIV